MNKRLAMGLRALSTLALAFALLVSVGLLTSPVHAWGDEQGSTATEQSQSQTGQAEESSAEAESSGNDMGVSLDEGINEVKEDQLPDSSFIYDSSIADLAGADSYYDNMTVQVSGEAVDDVIAESVTSDYCWVVLWDNGNTVTVYMPRESADLIDTLGSYNRKGTTLQVRGVFNLVCSEHDGVSDLHAENVTVLERGFSTEKTINPADFTPGFVLLLLGGALTIGFFRLREKQR